MSTPWELSSVLVILAFSVWSIFFHGHCKKVALTALQTFTFGVLIAGVLLFIPCYWELAKSFEDLPVQVGYTATMSLADAIRLFLLDVKWNELEELNYGGDFLYISFLSVLAPLLTFSNVLSFFGSFFGTMRMSLCMLRKVFVMSELNVQSLALAKDIRSRRQGLLPPVIVFAAVTEEHPLREQARQLSGLCLKGEICDLPIAPIGRQAEFFLLGEDESVNVSCADQLRKRHEKKLRAVRIFAYARASYADALLCEDRHQAPNLSRSFLRNLKKDPEAIFKGDRWMHTSVRPSYALQVFRLDPVELLVKEVLTAKDYTHYKALMPTMPAEETINKQAEKVQALETELEERKDTPDAKQLQQELAQQKDHLNRMQEHRWTPQEKEALEQQETENLKNGVQKTISIVVLGMGRYGTQFLKTALWFYQRNGCRLQFDVFDMTQQNGDAEARLKLSCPEIFTKKDLKEDGEAAYSIRFHRDVDCLSEAFGRQVKDDLADADLIFVSLGDDDSNIQTAINLRTLYARLGKKASGTPYIYSVIYDDTKLSNLHAGQMDDCLLAEDGKSNYHIHFVGTLATQYSYTCIEKLLCREKDSLRAHLNWSRKERQLHRLYNIGASNAPHPNKEDCIRFKEQLDKEQGGAENVQWYDDTLPSTDKKPADTPPETDIEAVKKNIWTYFCSPYCHNSSMATAEHKDAGMAAGYLPTGHFSLCQCLRCEDRRKTEHMRWNAYMRVCGYTEISCGEKNTLAKLHPDLKPLSRISLRERYKD